MAGSSAAGTLFARRIKNLGYTSKASEVRGVVMRPVAAQEAIPRGRYHLHRVVPMISVRHVVPSLLRVVPKESVRHDVPWLSLVVPKESVR